MTDLRGSAPTRIDSELEGIGGWLILPIIHLLIFIASVGWGFYVGVSEASPQVNTPSDSDLTSPVLALGILSVVGFIYAIVCLVRLLQRKANIPALMVCFYVLNVAIAALTVYAKLPDDKRFDFLDPTAASPAMSLVRTTIFATIWITYFLRSERVRNTFVR